MFPSVGQKIQLEPILQEGKKEKVYSSRVADIPNTKTFHIELPIDPSGSTELFPSGTEFTCWFIGEDGGQYRFRTRLMDRTRDPIPLWIMERPMDHEIERSQRRHHLRVEAHLDLAVKSLNEARPYHYITQTLDVSGGGLSFFCPSSHEIQKGDRLRGFLPFHVKNEGMYHVDFVGEVVRLFYPERAEVEVASVKFHSIRERDMEALVRYTFQRQIELYKKEND
ncbi:flagellar brake protein [Thermicanus aegyptius]|uniref:flagellar brake protein n=1 Tax=Thermicanus aegyptius TaxID=94009 RepID=UPI000401A9E8|nr:flagellar brake domain-containing protein [Thermicanus aegyptius]